MTRQQAQEALAPAGRVGGPMSARVLTVVVETCGECVRKEKGIIK